MSAALTEPEPQAENKAKNTNTKKTEVKPVDKNLSLMRRQFPYKDGHIRRVHHLWDNKYYRVNYHDRANQNYIDYSFFVTLLDPEKGSIKVEWEDRIAPATPEGDSIFIPRMEIRECKPVLLVVPVSM